MLTNKQRFYAIFKAFYFGVLPSWFYEKNCHYSDGEGMDVFEYYEHLKINLLIVKSLVNKTEHPSTHDFHRIKVKKWFRWQY